MSHNSSFIDLVNDAKKRIHECTVQDVVEMLKKGEPVILVDTREDREWIQGNIESAIHIGKGVIERDIEKYFPNKEERVILYCGGGFRSAIAADNLQKMGYKKILSMDGGIRSWKEAGLPIMKTEE